MKSFSHCPIFFALSIFIIPLCLCIPVHAQDLTIHVINVTKGDATFIEFPDGTTWLIDQGNSGTSGTRVHDYIDALGYSSIDYVVATHFDIDHYGGIDEVLSAGSPPLSYTTAAYEHEGPKIEGDDSYTATWDSETSSPLRSSPSPGQTWNFGGVTVECVCVGHVNGDETTGYNTLVDMTQVTLGAQENSYSLGFRISWNGFDYLTCGDLTSDVEDVLAPKISSNNLDLLHVSHHGSSSSSSLYWCETLQPETAVISVGSSNSYGHPTQQTLDNLNGIGSAWGGVTWIYATEEGSGSGGSASNFSYLNDDIVITYNNSTNQYTIQGGATSDTYDADEGSGGPTATPTITPTPTPTPTGPTPTPTVTPTYLPGSVVVNQVGPFSIAGGGIGEFVELYNNADSSVNLKDWTLNVYSGDYTFTVSDVIPAHGYYLIADENPCGGVVPDVFTDIGITDNGANSFAQLINSSSGIEDTVGWASASLYEGTRLGTLGTGKAWKRSTDGVDTDDNTADFTEVSPSPRNSSSGPPPTPTVTPTPTDTPLPTSTPTPTQTPLPDQVFFDDFPSDTINATNWTSNSGPAESNTTGIAEPSGSYSLNLDGRTSGGDEIQSKTMDLSGYDQATLTYYWQRKGNGNSPESGEDLWIDYWNGTGWINLAQYLGSGSDMEYYQFESISLPAGAFHSSFRIRVRSNGTAHSTQSFDDWLVDDIEIRAGMNPPTPTPSPTPSPTPTTGWTYPIQMNYQPAASTPPPNFPYLDDGSSYGTYGQYGWL